MKTSTTFRSPGETVRTYDCLSVELLTAVLGDEPGRATSLRRAIGRPIDRNAFAATFLNLLEKWCLTYRLRGAGPLLAAWRDRDVVKGRSVAVAEGGRSYRGRVVGINDDGQLLIHDSQGVNHQVIAGEIRLAE
jgi:biotin-(acetyl-CoA carboxylase) ligase